MKRENNEREKNERVDSLVCFSRVLSSFVRAELVVVVSLSAFASSSWEEETTPTTKG